MINTGNASCETLQSCLKELAFLTGECEVRAVNLDTKANRLAGHLSRVHIKEFHKQQFCLITEGYSLTEYNVHESLFDFIGNWGLLYFR